MSSSPALGLDRDWGRPRRAFFWFHYALSWVGLIGFAYILFVTAFDAGLGHIVDGIYAAVFLKTGRFAWNNGTVIVISIFYCSYSLIAVLPKSMRWRHHGYLSDVATVLAIVYINLNVHQVKLIMMPVGLWWLVQRWIAHFSLRINLWWLVQRWIAHFSLRIN